MTNVILISMNTVPIIAKNNNSDEFKILRIGKIKDAAIPNDLETPVIISPEF